MLLWACSQAIHGKFNGVESIKNPRMFCLSIIRCACDMNLLFDTLKGRIMWFSVGMHCRFGNLRQFNYDNFCAHNNHDAFNISWDDLSKVNFIMGMNLICSAMGKVYPKMKISRKSRSKCCDLVFFDRNIFNSNDTRRNFVDEITVANHVVLFHSVLHNIPTTGQPRKEKIIFFSLVRQLRLNKSTIVCHGNEWKLQTAAIVDNWPTNDSENA